MKIESDPLVFWTMDKVHKPSDSENYCSALSVINSIVVEKEILAMWNCLTRQKKVVKKKTS
jgi:hypothetical protein